MLFPIKRTWSQSLAPSDNGRPIVDINGEAFLWHMGYYNNASYKDFDTSGVLYRIEQDEIIGGEEEIPPYDPTQVFNITYVLDGGENNEANPSTYTLGESFDLLDPAREGYTFQGWFTDKGKRNQIWSINPYTTGDLTLYAKWRPEQLVVDDADLTDMSWSWWTYPLVISDEYKTFWGYATKDGYCGVAVFDQETGKVTRTILKQVSTASDTTAPAVMLLEDKRVMCVYAKGESAQKQIHIRISDDPLDISSFETDITLATANTASFSQVMQCNGKYYVFYRVNGNGSWAYRTSVDGEEWSGEKVLIRETSMQYYCKFMPTTDDNLIRILMCRVI